MDVEALIESRIPIELRSEIESSVSIVIVRLSKQALPQIDSYPGKLPFYHFGVRIGEHVYELIGQNLTQKEDGTQRYRLIDNLVETSFESYKNLECQHVYLRENCIPHILHRFNQIKDLHNDPESEVKLLSLNPDLKPYYDLMWCNCEHLATYLVSGVASCTQVDYVDKFIGTEPVVDDIIKWIQTTIDSKIETKYTNQTEAMFMKFLANHFVEIVVGRLTSDKLINKEVLLFVRRTLNSVIAEFSIPQSIYGPLTPVFGMLCEN